MQTMAEKLIADGYPYAPLCGDDAHEIAGWLRELIKFHDGDIESKVAVQEVLWLFEHANAAVRESNDE
jgi:hypothetical protein